MRNFRRIVSFWLLVVVIAVWPVAAIAADREAAEIKYALSNLTLQVEALQIQMATLRGSFDHTTNTLRQDLASMQSNLAALKNGKTSDAPSFQQAQFTDSLHDLSGSVTHLDHVIAELKIGSGKSDYQEAVERQISALAADIAGFTNHLLNAKSTGEAETRNSLAFIKSSLGSLAHATDTWPGWMNYLPMGLLVCLLGLWAWMFTNFRGQLGAAEQRTRETREILVRFGSQMEGRVKSMEGSSVAVQNSAREITDCLTRVESAVQAQLQTVSQQLNAVPVAELAGGAAKTAEQMSQLRTETAELQKFMGELRHATENWMKDFERQTDRALVQIHDDSQSFEKVLWPEPFFGDGKLGPARERIRARATAGDKAALSLLLALGRFQLALASRDGDFTPMVEALDQLGIMAYEFWKLEPDASVENTFELAQAWGSELNKLLTAHNLPLSIRIIMPRAGFDMATMLSERSLTGTTTRVREPLSWVVVSRGNGQQPPKVLVTGKVITE